MDGQRRALRFGKSSALCGWLLLAASSSFDAATVETAPAEHASLEYTVKAGFLFNFIKFTSWPEERLAASEEPLRICVWGASPFEELLAPFEEKSIKGHRLEINHPEAHEEIPGCHVLYLAIDQPRKLDALLPRLAGSSILTVGDLEGFARRGGMIGFVERDGKVAFEINPRAVERGGLRISSNLLELAIIVGSEGP